MTELLLLLINGILILSILFFLFKKNTKPTTVVKPISIKKKTIKKAEISNGHPVFNSYKIKLDSERTLYNIAQKIIEFYSINNINLKYERGEKGLTTNKFFFSIPVQSKLEKGVEKKSMPSIKKIESNIDDLQIHLSGRYVSFVPFVKGTKQIAFEVSTKSKKVGLGNALNDHIFSNRVKLPLVLGYANNDPAIIDLSKSPHILIGGATGSGKTVLLKSIIAALKYLRPNTDIIIIDPKRVDFQIFNNITTVITDIDKISNKLQQLVTEMNHRYTLFEQSKCSTIEDYNKKHIKKMKYKVILVDELADILISKEKTYVEMYILQLVQKARACGIHLILCTQRPDTNVITGTLKANCPTRIALQCASRQDSSVILDERGAERLAGNGDSLLKTTDGKIRFQSCMISNKEIQNLTNHLQQRSL